MDYLSQVLFFFGAVGLFNSLILAMYLLLSKSYVKLDNRLFGFFLIILSIRVLKSLFYAFSTIEPIWFLQTGPAFFLLIGPALFNYVAVVGVSGTFWSHKWKIHLFVWVLAVCLMMVVMPFWNFRDLYKDILLPIINFQWLLYIMLSGLLVFKGIKRGKRLTLLENWLMTLLLSNLILWICLSIIGFDYFITGSLVFSLLFYVIFLFFQFKKRLRSKVFPKNKGWKPVNIVPHSQKLLQQLQKIMEEQKLYVDPKLKIADLADKVDATPHELSKFLNVYLNQSFTEFVNNYRIEEAKNLLLSSDNRYTIEAIGNLSGFNSKSAFYKAFKSRTGLTPAKFTR